MIDPDYDDRLYCSRCLHLIGDDDIPRDDEDACVMGCPYCYAGLLMAIRHDQMLGEKARRRSDWEAAKGDGLIL